MLSLAGDPYWVYGFWHWKPPFPKANWKFRNFLCLFSKILLKPIFQLFFIWHLLPTLTLSISTFTNQTTLTAKDFLKPESRNLCQFPGASQQLSSSSPESGAPSTRAGREESRECEGFIVCFRLSWSSAALHMWTHGRHTMFWKGGIVMSIW